jgi:2-oxoglutarate ferredoxin oxidoreductase subunit alpha
VEKIRNNADKIVRYEEDDVEGADVVVVAYGISARVARLGIELARKKGVKVGFLRLIIAWPFPEKRIRELAGKVKAFVMPEINLGQMVLEIERCAAGKAKTVLVPHSGGGVHDPETIVTAIMEAAK